VISKVTRTTSRNISSPQLLIHINLSMSLRKDNTTMKNHEAVMKTNVWKKSTGDVSESASPEDNFNSFDGDIGPSRYKPPQPTNPKDNNSFGDIGPSRYKPPPTDPTSA
jgi:hypothetical protein